MRLCYRRRVGSFWLLLIFLIMGACSAETESGSQADRAGDTASNDTGILDPNVRRFVSGDLEIPGYADSMLCTFGTWTGGNLGVVSFRSQQSSPMGHHAMFMRANAGSDNQPIPDDGTVIACDDWPLDNLFQSTGEANDGGISPTGTALPDGMAMKLADGTRWAIQSHYVNTGADPVTAIDTVLLGVVEPSQVTTWAAVYSLNNVGFNLPPGQAQTSFPCSFDHEFYVMSLMGHMHEYGTSIKVELGVGNEIETIYEIAEWKAEYRDQPVVTTWLPGEFLVPAETVITTSCAWNNITDQSLHFPQEMCSALGVGYPSEEPIACNAGIRR